MEKVQLSKKGLQNDIEAGLTRVMIAEKYHLSVAQIASAMKQTGLTGLRAKFSAFEIVEEEVEVPVVETPVVVPEVKPTQVVNKTPVEPLSAPFSGVVVENED